MSDNAAPDSAAPVAEDAPLIQEVVDSGKFYRIQSEDKFIYNISEEAVKHSETIQVLISNLGYTAEDVENKDPILLEEVNGDALELAIKWCEHNKGKPIPVDDGSVPKNVMLSEFDKDLLDIDDSRLYALVIAADNLNINGLVDVITKKIALMGKGKSPDEMRIIYCIPTDEEDEAAAKEKQEAEKVDANPE